MVAVGVPEPEDRVFRLYLVGGVLFAVNVVGGEFRDMRTGGELANNIYFPFGQTRTVAQATGKIVFVIKMQQNWIVCRFTCCPIGIEKICCQETGPTATRQKTIYGGNQIFCIIYLIICQIFRNKRMNR